MNIRIALVGGGHYIEVLNETVPVSGRSGERYTVSYPLNLPSHSIDTGLYDMKIQLEDNVVEVCETIKVQVSAASSRLVAQGAEL